MDEQSGQSKTDNNEMISDVVGESEVEELVGPYQNEVDEEIKRADFRDKVKHSYHSLPVPKGAISSFKRG